LVRPLAAIGQSGRACRAEIVLGGKIFARWIEEPGSSGPRQLGPLRALEAGSKFQGKARLTLRLWRNASDPFLASDEAFLQTAAQALAPYLPVEAEGASAASSVKAASIDETQPLQETSRLKQTQRLLPRVEKTAALLQYLKDEGMIATGAEMQKVVRALRAFSRTELPVLITGESGTGKNLVASALHRFSSRAKGPLLTQNASAVPPELFEADLFGYERGAFTGADQTRSGFLFKAQTGTFHLEEIGDLEPSLQQRLLQVIEEKVVRPLGATSSRPIDVRFLASTHRDIEGMVRRGEFRKDLFFRLDGARIHVPPLRQRLDEIPELVAHYWRELTGSTVRFSLRALNVLSEHDWPGNVRELISVLRRLSLNGGASPGASEVRGALGQRASRGLFPPDVFNSRPYADLQRDLEEGYLVHLYQKHDGSLAAIAAAMKTTTRSIYRRFERLGLKPRSLRRE
jgi:transcriptional regulator with PAS, ATPase and Fis domain